MPQISPARAAIRDIVGAVVFLAIATVSFAEAWTFPDKAGAWPQWMWGVLAVFSLILLVDALRRLSAARRQTP